MIKSALQTIKNKINNGATLRNDWNYFIHSLLYLLLFKIHTNLWREGYVYRVLLLLLLLLLLFTKLSFNWCYNFRQKICWRLKWYTIQTYSLKNIYLRLCSIVGFHMTSLEFKLQNYRSYWDLTFVVY